jgi:preprotein translocase subunit SecF
MEFPNIYKGDYRLLAIPPLLLVLVSLYFIPQISMGVDFRGGTLISLTLDEPIDTETLEMQLASEGLDAEVKVFDTAVGYKAEIGFPQSDRLVEAEELKDQFEELLPYATNLEILAEMNESRRAEYEEKREEIDAVADRMFALAGINTEAGLIDSVNELEKAFSSSYKKVYSDYQESVTEPINKYVEYDSISVQTVSPMLREHFIETAVNVAIMAAILSAVFVFLFFRVVIPSIAVIVGAACDIIIALGAMGLFGIPLTLPSFAALLMLVGYSLDTDILLTMRMLKRRGDPKEKAHGAMKTGLTMSVTGVIAFATLFILAQLTHIPTYFEISAVALSGLVGDMLATWGINAVMLLWYVEKKGEY